MNRVLRFSTHRVENSTEKSYVRTSLHLYIY